MKSLWRRDDDEIARMIANLITQKDGLWSELTRATTEVARLQQECAELQVERDKWRERAERAESF